MPDRTFIDWISLIIDRYGMWFLQGAGVTMLVALTGTVIGFIIGLIVSIIRTIPLGQNEPRYSPRRILLTGVNFILNCYIEIFRGTPMMVQAMVLYYGMMEAFNLDIPALPAGIIVVTINTGAYMAEVIRGGIESIDKGQTEAAHAIGMTHGQTMINVILPQAIRNVLPATGNEFVINIKDTSVLNVISVSELFFMTKSVNGVILRTYEVFLVASVIYFVLTFTVTRLLRLLERKLDGPDHYTIHGSSTMIDSSFKVDRRIRRRRGGWGA